MTDEKPMSEDEAVPDQAPVVKERAYLVDLDTLPPLFPTHRHEAAFWESLGRAVATFSFLEEVLGRAIFALTTTRRYEDEEELRRAYDDWPRKLETALSDPLGPLIGAFDKAVRDHDAANNDARDQLLEYLRAASQVRNILCHGSWGTPDASGASLPRFVTKRNKIADTRFDGASLDQVRKHAAELSAMIIDTVTRLGHQFPGSRGPGEPIWNDETSPRP